MSIYWNSSEISEIYYGENISEVYFGSDLVWSACKYEPGQILFESSTAGTYSFTPIQDSVFEIICVAGGGGGAHSNYYFANQDAGGGSGGGFSIQARLTKGVTYSIRVGDGGNGNAAVAVGVTGATGANSAFGTLQANGGKGGWADWANGANGGDGGGLATLSDSANITIKTTDWNLAGNKGGTDSDHAIGGAAVYHSYGKGGNGQTKGNVGYVRVKFISKK